MGLEAATYISDLNASNPASGDAIKEGDDHIRLIKSAVKTTFPNVTGAVTPTHTELNYVDGVTSSIQTQINTANSAIITLDTEKLDLAGGTMTGTLVLDADPTDPLDAATKQYADTMLPKAGGTMTGALVLAGGPTTDLNPATKKYVDDLLAAQTQVVALGPTANINLNSIQYLAHGLDLVVYEIKDIHVMVECLSAEHGYAIGDKVSLMNYYDGTYARRSYIGHTDTYVFIQRDNSGIFAAPKPTYPDATANTMVALDQAKWGFVATVWYKAI